jgi:CLN3 protein
LEHYNSNEWGWQYRMFFIGFINNASIGVMLMYTSSLSAEMDRNLEFAMYVVFLQAVPIIANIINSLWFINTSHESRLIVASICFICSYILIAFSINDRQDEDMSLPFAIAACLVNQLGRSIGEATVLGYMKALPQELIVAFGTGQGTGSFFNLFIGLILAELSIWKHTSFLILAVLVIPYFHFFAWIEDQRLFHKQFRNVFRVDENTLEMEAQLHLGQSHSPVDSGSERISVTQLDHDAYKLESPLPS